MLALILLAVLALPIPSALAQDDYGALSLDSGSAVKSPVDAGLASSVTAITVSEPVIKIAVVPTTEITPSPAITLKDIVSGVRDGNWWLVAGALLVLIVGLLRKYGKKFHAWIPDDNFLDKPLYFLFDSKIGGWVLNWLTAIAGGLGTAIAAGVTVDWTVWKSVMIISVSGTALFELWDDICIWWESKGKKEAPKPVEPAPAPGA